MAEQSIDFKIGVASDALAAVLDAHNKKIDEMTAKLASLGVGGASAYQGGAGGSAPSGPTGGSASAAAVAQASVQPGVVPPAAPYAPPQQPSGAAQWMNAASTIPSGFPGTAGGAAQTAQASAGFNWSPYPNSPANPHAYGPAAPGSQGYNSWYANQQAQQAQQANAPFDWSLYPNSPANPNQYGPGASGSLGSNANAAAQQRAEEAAAQQRRIMNVTFGAIGVRAVSQGLDNYAHNMASGDYDVMGAAGLLGGMTGAITGGIAGALLSPLEPGTGAAVGALAGQSLGAASLQAIVAPWVRQRNAEVSLQSIAAREAVSVHRLAGAEVGGEMNAIFPKRDRFGNPQYEGHSRHISGELDALQESISFSGKDAAQVLAIKMGIYAGRDIISLPQISQVYSAVGSGLLAAGDDPDDALSMTDRLSRKYFMGAPAMANRAARVAAMRNQQGGNRADMLLASGPEDYGAWTDATPGEEDITPSQRTAYGQVQRHNYRASRAASMVRGSGAAMEAAWTDAAQEIRQLPDGESSMAFASANASRRDARSDRYSQENLPYDLRMSAIEGERARAEVLPYSPAFRPRIAVQAIGLLTKQIGVEEGRYAHDMAGSDMTEEEQLRRFGHIQDLRTERARDVSTVSLGGENRMLALSAGTPEFFSRMDSERVAQTMLIRTGNTWNRAHGALGGQQLAAQQKWLSEAGGDDMAHTLTPFSRTSDMNSSLSTGNIEKLLQAILAKMDSGGSVAIGGTRRSEARGQISALLDTQTLDADSLYHRSG